MLACTATPPATVAQSREQREPCLRTFGGHRARLRRERASTALFGCERLGDGSPQNCSRRNPALSFRRPDVPPFDSALGESKWFASKIRQGYRLHPRHWRALAKLVGMDGE